MSDTNANHFVLFKSAIVWLVYRLDCVSNVVTLVVALLVVLSGGSISNPSTLGLALSYTIQVTIKSSPQYSCDTLVIAPAYSTYAD